jgi:NAD(P)H-hydrate repair Nnr-like enzyme with NAD(P)H-hydrate dehydratase domain
VAGLDLDLSGARPNAWVADRTLFESALKPRPRNFHKGNAGSLGIIGGARGMTGAALLSGRSALKLGAGRVYVGLLEHLAVDFSAPELMLRLVDDGSAGSRRGGRRSRLKVPRTRRRWWGVGRERLPACSTPTR